ncbi:hypothetical protein GIB67_038985 [Kingdonia uniflora]|uniref:DUF4283 domain-containing protein n=1 Tax=Kingdonia uniflora TaxID=39325 RepID=A0A7J7P723_9MAGN|nr:hypothetical protein GIB67_038985 [Kingdonia uniflora]
MDLPILKFLQELLNKLINSFGNEGLDVSASSLRKLMQNLPTNAIPTISPITPTIRSEDNLDLHGIQVSIGNPTKAIKEQLGQEQSVVCPWGFMKMAEGTERIKPQLQVKSLQACRVYKPKKISLIGRLDLQKVKFKAAQEYARTQWKLLGKCKLIPLGKGFFIIKLDNESDKIHIWGQGPWMVEKILMRLPSELWSHKIVMSLGKTLGAPIHLDRSTINHDYGYHASVLVDIDLSTSIPNHVFIEAEGKLINQEILLYRVPKFYNHCKNVGHSIAECKVIQRAVRGEQKQAPKTVKKYGTTKSTGNGKVAPR